MSHTSVILLLFIRRLFGVIILNSMHTIMVSGIVLVLLTSIGTGQHLSGHHNYRRQMNLMRNMAQKAYEHGLRINEEAQCSKPRPELVYLTDSNKIYLPRATMLHRCSDLTGCCPHATHSCQASRVEKVNLYFFTINVHSQARLRQNQNIEQLSFVNHTECACMPIDPQVRSEQIRRIGQNLTNLRTVGQDESLPMVNSPLYSNNEVESENNSLVGDSDNMLKYWARVLGYENALVVNDNEEKHEAKRNYGTGPNSLMVQHSSKPKAVRYAAHRSSVLSLFNPHETHSPKPYSSVIYQHHQPQTDLYPSLSPSYLNPSDQTTYKLAYRTLE